MDSFIVGNEIQNVKDHLLALRVEYMKLHVAIEKGSRKISDSLLVTVLPKEKLVARKWMSKMSRKEVTVKDKI